MRRGCRSRGRRQVRDRLSWRREVGRRCSIGEGELGKSRRKILYMGAELLIRRSPDCRCAARVDGVDVILAPRRRW